jgi:hypothetical protein
MIRALRRAVTRRSPAERGWIAGRLSPSTRDIPSPSTKASCVLVAPALAPEGAPPSNPSRSATPATAATANAVAPARSALRRARAFGSVAALAAGAQASAGPGTASWMAAARSPQKSSALGGGSVAVTRVGGASDAGRRRPNGTSSSRGPIHSSSRTTLVSAGASRLPSVLWGPSLSNPLTTPCRCFCAYPAHTVRTRRYSLPLIWSRLDSIRNFLDEFC